MKRLAPLMALTAAAVLAGCGSSGSSSPLDAGLSYLPKNAPFAVSIDTNVNGSQYKSISKILDKFPFGGQLKQSLQQRLRQSSKVNYGKDIKPILGNPFVVGGINPRSVTDNRSDNEFVGAIKAKDKDKLVSLVKKQGAKETGDEHGAKLYTDNGGSPFAIKDDVLVVAGSKKLLDDALARADGGEHLSEDAYNQSLNGLPKDALVRVYANVGGLIRSDPTSRDALRVKWVNSLTTLGATLQATDNAFNVAFRLSTKPGLSDSDLPLAAGDTAPPVVERPGEIGFGLRDPSQLIKFAESTAQTVNPTSYGQFSAAKRQIQQRYHVNIDTDVVDQLTGDSSTSTSVAGKSVSRIALKDPAAFRKTLAKLAPAIPTLSSGNAKLVRPASNGGLYGLVPATGKRVSFGVVGKYFVAGNDTASARRFASASATDIANAKGAAVLKANAEQVVNAALQRLGPQLGLGGAFGSRLFTQPLGDLDGSVSSSTSGLSGSFSLGVD